MKNIEKYTNTKDALEEYNNSVKNVPFDEWLELEYKEPHERTLLAAAKREREATCEKSSAVGKVVTVREVAQEMLNTSMQSITAERINGWATRLAEACEQPVTDCNQLNNAAAMREALEALVGVIDKFDSDNPLWWYIGAKGVKPLKDARAALSARPRNCDVGTAEEQAERFDEFCYNHRSREKGCGDCPLLDGVSCCELAWAQMPYETVKNKQRRIRNEK